MLFAFKFATFHACDIHVVIIAELRVYDIKQLRTFGRIFFFFTVS